MAVGLVESSTQDASSTVFCGFEKSFEHAYVLDLVFFLMLLPVVAILIRVVVTDSAPVFVTWICRPD